MSENDYGFTVEEDTSVLQNELKAEKKRARETVSSLQFTLKETKAELEKERQNKQKIKDIVIPLLENLAKDGDKKPVINWPNRDKILNEKIKEIKDL